eukprot:UN0891
MVVLNIFYNPELGFRKTAGQLDNPSWFTVAFVFSEFLVSMLSECVYSKCKTGEWFWDLAHRPYQLAASYAPAASYEMAETSNPRRLSTQSAQPYEADDDKLTLTNRYKDLSYPLQRVVMIFVVQSMLMAFYLFHLHEDNNNLHDGSELSCLKWFAGVSIVLFAGAGEMGDHFDISFWLRVHKQLSEKEHTRYCVHSSACSKCFPSLLNECRLRAGMSFLVNGVGLYYLRRTFPIILSTTSAWGFITDCMAIFFIVKLDNVTG